MERDGSEDGDLVLAARAGDEAAFAALVDRWLDRCWEVAWRILRDRDLAADVAQETLTTAWERLATLEQPGSFGGWVLRIARNRALNRLERERRTVATADDRTLEPTDRLVTADGPDEIVERDERASLLWAASAALGPRDASVLDLHLRHGMGPVELAEALEVTANNAHQLLFRLRARLGGAIRAHVLWHDGDPRCVALATALRTAGVSTFGPAAVRTISRHADGCDACEDDRSAILAPTALFGAVPLLTMPVGLRDGVLARLDGDGVPVPDGVAAGPPVDPPDDGDGDGDEVGAEPVAAGPVPAGIRRRAVVASIAALVLLLAAALAIATRGGPSDTLATGSDAASGSEPSGPDATTAGAAGVDTTPATDATPPPASAPAPPDPDGSTTDPATATTPDGAPASTAPRAGPVGAGGTGDADAPPAPAPPMAPAPPTTAPPTAPPTTAPAPPTATLQVTDDPQPSCSLARRITWTTTGATTVALSVAGGPPAPVAASGATTVCETPGQPVVLTVSGPGGTTVAEATT